MLNLKLENYRNAKPTVWGRGGRWVNNNKNICSFIVIITLMRLLEVLVDPRGLKVALGCGRGDKVSKHFHVARPKQTKSKAFLVFLSLIETLIKLL